MRVGGSARKNLAVFTKLCGDGFLPNVVLVTTMWKTGMEREYEARENQLRTNVNLFQPFLEKGVTLSRHVNTRDSAATILKHIINKAPRAMRIQEELVIEKKDLGATEAAEFLDKEYRVRVENQRKQLEELREELRGAVLNQDVETENELQKTREGLEEQIKKMIDNVDHFSSQYAEERRHRAGTSGNIPSRYIQQNTLSDTYGLNVPVQSTGKPGIIMS